MTAPSSRGAVLAAWSGWPGRIARLLLAVVPLAWISTRVHWSHVAARAYALGARPIAIAFVYLAFSYPLAAVRWRLLLRAYGADAQRLPSHATLTRHFAVGQYFNVLPSGVAGDVVRALRVASVLPDTGTSLMVVFVERLAGLLGLLLVAGGAMLFSPALRVGPLASVMNIGLSAATLLAAFAFVLPQLTIRSETLRARIAALPIAGRLAARLPHARNAHGPLLAVLLSVATQATVVLAIHALIAPLAPTATLAVCARIVPAIVLITYIPLTPGGLGQREAAFAAFFSLVHVDQAVAVAASLLFFALSLALAFLGGGALLYERFVRHETATVPDLELRASHARNGPPAAH